MGVEVGVWVWVGVWVGVGVVSTARTISRLLPEEEGHLQERQQRHLVLSGSGPNGTVQQTHPRQSAKRIKR